MGGTINVIAGFAPAENDTFDLVTCGGTGCGSAFVTENLPADFSLANLGAIVQLSFATCAGTICWDDDGGDGLWLTAINWTTDLLPGALDDVVIDFGGGNTVTLSSGIQTINSLINEDSLIIFGGAELRLTSTSNSNGDLALGGTLGGAGDLTVNGLFDWGSGGDTFVNISGGLITTATTNLNSTGDKRVDTTWTNQGIVNWNDGDIHMAGGTFNNDATFNILTADGNDVIEGGGGVFNNNATGTVNKTLGGTIRFINNGSFTNTGLFDLDAGTLRLEQATTTTATGVYNIADGATLNFFASTHNVANPNAFVADTTNAQLLITNSTVNLNASTSLDADIDLTLSSATLSGSADLTVNGLFDWGAFTIVNIAGGLITAATSTTNLNDEGDKRVDTTWTNQGIVNWNDGDIHINGGTFNNDATFNILTDDIGDLIEGAGGVFNNNAAGIVNKTSTVTTRFTNTGAKTNSGLVNISAGTLEITSTYTQSAGETRLSGGNLTTTFALNGGSLTGNGTVTGNVTSTGGTIAPGLSPDILLITGDLILDSTSVVNIELEGTTPGPNPGGHDQIQVTGTASLDGTLNVTLPGAFTPGAADTFTIITCDVSCLGGVTMQFTTENSPAGQIMTVNYNANDVVLDNFLAGLFWDNQTGNDLWTDPLNWSTDTLPGVADNVLINIVEGEGVFINTGIQSINSLVSDEDIIINGGTLTIANSSQLNGGLTIGPGGTSVLNGTGDVTVSGLTSWTGNGSTIGGSGTLFANAGVDIDFAGGTRNLDRTLQMSGTSTWTTAFGGALNGTGQVVNLGTLNATNPTTFNVNTGFDNTVGTINKSAGVGGLRFAGAFNNDNQVTVDAGAVDLANTGTHTGVFTVNAGGTLQTSAGTVTMSGATVSGAGTVLATAGTLVVDGASTYNVGDTQINGGTITFNTNVDTTTLTIGPGGTSVLNGTGDVTVSGLTSWTGNGSTIGGSGTLFANAGVDIDFAGGTRNLDRTLQMSGTSTWTTAFGGALNGTGQVVNLGTLNATNPTTFNVNTGFDNTVGTINKSAGVGGLRFAGAFNNDNQVTVDAGAVDLANTGTHTGVFTVNAGGTLQTSAGTVTMSGATVSGAGTVLATAGTLVVDGASTYNVGDTQINGGTITFNTNVDTTTLTIGPGGTSVLNGTGDVTVSGLTSWTGNGSTIGGSGTLFATAGVDVDFAGGTRNLDRTLQMSGTSTWTTAFGGALNGTGQVVNLGTLDATNTSTITVNNGFDNQGIFNNSGTGTFTFAEIFTNSGGINAQTGVTSFTGTFSQTAGITDLAGGSVTSTSPMSFTGGALIGFGTITGDVTIDTATLSPGNSPEILNVTNLVLTSNAIFDVDVDGLIPGVGGHDQVNVTNNATIDGTLNVNLGFVPTDGDTFDFLTCGGACTGTFAVENLPADFVVNYSAPLVQLEFASCIGTICWDGGGGDNFWINALNWTTDLLPVAGDDVVVDFGGGLTVDLDDTGTTHTINSLLVEDNLTITDGTLSVTGGATINGALAVTGGSIDFNGVTGLNAVTVSGGDLNSIGAVIAISLVHSAGALGGGGSMTLNNSWAPSGGTVDTK